MDTQLRVTPRMPPLWEIEWRVVEITCEQLGLDRARVTPQSRLLEDLHLDSLEVIELIMELEEAFGIWLPDTVCQQFFTQRALTLATLAELVRHRWGTGPPDRSGRGKRKSGPQEPSRAPFTQLDGKCPAGSWQEGQLYELLGPNREGFTQYRRRTDGMRCVAVPGAEASIGSSDFAALADQGPLHRVELTRFLIDAEPVSTSAFSRFLNSVGKLPSSVLGEWCGVDHSDRRGEQYPLVHGMFGGWKPIRGTEGQPMMLVSWYGANAYSLWANRLDWRAYRGDLQVVPELVDSPVQAPPPPADWLGTCLPSEAQWEYAARGAEPRAYPWGDEPRDGDAMCVARHIPGASYSADGIPAPSVNALAGLSPFGLHHMAANVWQWCRDWYAHDFYRTPEATRRNAQNANPGHARSERGGSWVGPAELARSSYRRGRPPAVRGRCLGFRCVGALSDLP